MADVESLSPHELARRIEAGDDVLMLDVREPREWAICRIAGSISLPMSEFAGRHGELDSSRPIVCICHHGIRSANVAAALARLGFERLYNLSGGIEQWALDVDPSMRRY